MHKFIKNIIPIVFIVIPACLLLFVLLKPHKKISASSNNRIIAYYTEVLIKDSLFLNQVAEAFVQTKYKGKMGYNCENAGGYHTLWGREGDNAIQLTDSFPIIRLIIKNKYPDARKCLYDFNYNNGAIFIYLEHSSLFNQINECVLLLYCPNPTNLQLSFSNYRIYPKNAIPKEPFNWLYQIDNNWYICSPDKNIRFMML